MIIEALTGDKALEKLYLIEDNYTFNVILNTAIFSLFQSPDFQVEYKYYDEGLHQWIFTMDLDLTLEIWGSKFSEYSKIRDGKVVIGRYLVPYLKLINPLDLKPFRSGFYIQYWESEEKKEILIEKHRRAFQPLVLEIPKLKLEMWEDGIIRENDVEYYILKATDGGTALIFDSVIDYLNERYLYIVLIPYEQMVYETWRKFNIKEYDRFKVYEPYVSIYRYEEPFGQGIWIIHNPEFYRNWERFVHLIRSKQKEKKND